MDSRTVFVTFFYTLWEIIKEFSDKNKYKRNTDVEIMADTRNTNSRRPDY